MGDFHVLPVGDLREHEETRTCWCKPDVMIEAHDVGCPFIADDESDMVLADYGECVCDAPAVVTHNSLDGRELVERHWLQ